MAARDTCRPRLSRRLASVAIACIFVALLVPASDAGSLSQPTPDTAGTQSVVDGPKDALARGQAEYAALVRASTPVTALFVGDSVAGSLALAYGPQLNIPLLTVQSAAIDGCGISRGRVIPVGGTFGQQDCSSWPNDWKTGVETFHPDVSVILIGSWDVYDRNIDGRDYKYGSADDAAYLRSELDRGLSILTEFGAPVVVLSKSCNSEEAHGSMFGWSVVLPWFNLVLRSFVFAHPTQVTWVDDDGFVCPLKKWAREVPSIDFFPDGMHFSPAGAALVWSWLGPELVHVAHRSGLPMSGAG